MNWAVFAVALLGCAARVSQDRATGPNGRIEGALPMTWATAERAVARGTVTYPGGDRVDWWSVRLPDSLSDVEIELRWKPPRPGLRLSFDVFGDDHGQILAARRTATRARASLSRVRGDHFIRVYARGRGDAGTYALVVTRRDNAPIIDDWHATPIPSPPRLPHVPRWEPVIVPVYMSEQGSEPPVVIVTAGGNECVDLTWRATAVRSEAPDAPALPDGEGTIVHVDTTMTRVRLTKLTRAKLNRVMWLRLEPGD